MSKKFRSQASSARVASASTGFGFGSSFQTSSSSLSYVTELPDLSQISEPNVVVAFKNLGKKDSTTKAKALEDLQDYATSAEGGVEDGILSAWGDIYPRTSIDNSRRVRQLAHTLQGSLTLSVGKRIAPFLPKVIPSWLAGTFDNDKTVSKAAQDALAKSFSTVEKRRALWRVYKDALFEYIEDSILIQTKDTLSDERTTSPDDAEAKHVRVVGTAMHLLIKLLEDGTDNEILVTLLSGKRLWELVYHEDAYLRRVVCGLAQAASAKCVDHLDWALLSTCFLSKGLHSSQIGSTRQYTETLLVLTQRRPQIWTTDYTAKTAASKRFSQFIRQGSQNGPEDVWSNIFELITTVPTETWILKDDLLESATSLVEALRTGVALPSERLNASSAWTTYVKCGLWLAEKLEDQDKDNFMDRHLTPIVSQFVTRKGDQHWTIANNAVRICRLILDGVIKLDRISLFETIWSELASQTLEQAKMSLPETSKDFKLSQDAVIAQAGRLFELKNELASSVSDSTNFRSILTQKDSEMLDEALEVLKARNAKPYSAAGLVELVVGQPSFDRSNAQLQSFLKNDLSNYIDSPSSERLIHVCLLCGFDDVAKMLLQHQSSRAESAMSYYLGQVSSANISADVQASVVSRSKNLSEPIAQNFCVSIIQNQFLDNSELQSAIVATVLESLSMQSSHATKAGALTVVDDLVKRKIVPGMISSDETRSAFLSRLLVLADGEDELSEQATTLIKGLNSRVKSGASSISIVQEQLSGSGTPLSIFTLIDLANSVVQSSASDVNPLIPSAEQWQRALIPHISSPRPYSLAVTSSLQGLVYMLEGEWIQKQDKSVRDSDDFSLAFRLVLYFTRLANTTDIVSKLDESRIEALYQYYPVALELVNEKLTVEKANEIWLHTTPEVLQEAADVLSDGRRIVRSWSEIDGFVEYWLPHAHHFDKMTIETYCQALAWVNIAAQYVDEYGPSRLLQDYEQELKTLHRSQEIVQSCCLLAVLREHLSASAHGKRICNEFVANATEAKNGDLKSLILPNILLQGNSDALKDIPSPRMVFLLKNLISLLEQDSVDAQAEVMRLLTAIVPQVDDIYGEYWEQILVFLTNLWSGNENLPALTASLRLYGRLKELLNSDEVNDDLQQAWNAVKKDLDAGLVNCLKLLGENTQEIDQPKAISAELLRRQLKSVDSTPDEDTFRYLSSSVDGVQRATYELFHRAIPHQQEQLSIELVLEHKAAHIPSELFAVLDSAAGTRQYLLAWNLVFDFFPNASFRLREVYTADVKESGFLDNFLNYVCDVLRIASGRPIDGSKYDVTEYLVGEADSPEKENQWLAVHTYYKCLLYLPSLAKDWFLLQKNRIKTPLESWTQKYVSQLIITASLSSVVDWAEAQTQDEDDRPLTIKSSPKGSELVASISVDPESPPISLAVVLPGSYPLDSPSVIPRTRVGVSEKNWQSWLRTIQIIIFSTGSIVEGLVAFRRNVQGALKGQNECAICYSIIGTDMQTPNKKCGTCKNTFHGVCLFRWFKSSNSSSCPLCRNNFNYA